MRHSVPEQSPPARSRRGPLAYPTSGRIRGVWPTDLSVHHLLLTPQILCADWIGPINTRSAAIARRMYRWDSAATISSIGEHSLPHRARTCMCDCRISPLPPRVASPFSRIVPFRAASGCTAYRPPPVHSSRAALPRSTPRGGDSLPRDVSRSYRCPAMRSWRCHNGPPGSRQCVLPAETPPGPI
jgi:hypothetical protein